MNFKHFFIKTILLFFLKLSIQSMHLKKQASLAKFDILIIGTNDIHGTVYPTKILRGDTNQTFEYGGLVYMASIIQTLRQQYKGNILYLDAGDEFQGGVQASALVSSGKIVSDYFNHINLNASAVGNHQFDFGPKYLQNYLSKLNNDILDANLIDRKDNSLPLKNQQRSKIYTFPIRNIQLGSNQIHQNLKQLKIGVIGLSTLQTYKTTSGFIDGPYRFPKQFQFLQYKTVIQQQAQKLKNKGVNAIIILSHVGNQCDKSTQYGFWTIKNQDKQIPCAKNDQIFNLLDQLPEGLIDAVVQGHRHVESHYFYKGVPIIGSINGGYYINTIRLRFTLDNKIAYLDKDEIYIQGPIPICAKIFQGTRRCDYIPPDEYQKAGKLTQWQFHGKKVQADQTLSKIFKQQYDKKMEAFNQKLLINYIQTPLIKDYAQNSKLGNLMTNLMANAIKKKYKKDLDFLIVNGGGFRTTWFPGIIRKTQLYSMFPFDGYVYTFKVLGRHLKKLIQKVQNGRARYYPTWGLQQIFSIDQAKSRSQHLIRHKHLLSRQKLRHQRQYLRLKQLISTLDKKQIQDDKHYVGATSDFLIGGGDDFYQIIQKNSGIILIQVKNQQVKFKNLIEEQLKLKGQLRESDLIGPNKMQRFVIENEDRSQQNLHELSIQPTQFN